VNRSLPDRPEYFWVRTFVFPGRKPFEFVSSMMCTGETEITEFVRFGFGLRLRVSAQDGGLIEEDLGYTWRVGQWRIPVPINMLMGRARIEEMPISDSEFEMRMALSHPLFGVLFAYDGRFALGRPQTTGPA
jgi:hypothetical protein